MTIILQLENDRERARGLSDPNHNVCYFALADKKGLPSIRTLVLRSISADGITLFTNKTSPKWKILEDNPHCQILLWYPSIQIQYRVSGICSDLGQSNLEQDWQRRPNKSKLLDHFYDTIQAQSQPIESRQKLTDGLKQLSRQIAPENFLMPASAGAFNVDIKEVEYLQLTQNEEPHFRELHTKTDTGWATQTLIP